MTTSTCGRSSPRAATSVARRMDGEEGVQMDVAKAVRARVRAEGVRWPWREWMVDPEGRTVGRI